MNPPVSEPMPYGESLRTLQTESARWQPPAALETSVLAALPRNKAVPSGGSRGLSWFAPACVAVCAAALISVWSTQAPPSQPTGGSDAAVALAIDHQSTPFVVLASAADIESARAPFIKVSDVARTTLPEFGFSFSPSRAHEPVRAEWLMSERGQALAVRFTDISFVEF